MPLLEFKKKYPKIDPKAYVSPRSFISGDVEVGAKSSVFDFASIRGDFSPIKIGKNTSIQDNCSVHCGMSPCSIGDNVTVGHNAVIHSATIGNNVIIGMHSTILDNAKIGDNCIVGAGAVVTEKMVVEDKTLVVGNPAKKVKDVGAKQIAMIRMSASSYSDLAQKYKKILES